MGCTSCATDNGLPKGCKSHGSCASGACNMMNTFDWLAEMPIAFGSQEGPEYYEITFNGGSRKEFFKNDQKVPVHTSDWVVVDTSMGYDIGQISLSGELVKLQMRKKKVKERNADFKNILRLANDTEFDLMKEAKALEQETMVRARAITRALKLDMKIGQVEFQADKKKATFYYTAEDRVDFRELIKEYAREFKVKIEMRQIGARQEAAKIGGIGSCGRELCCSTWLTDFKSVSTNAARYQNLSINLAKLSGQCGRLKCCLNYELDMYMEALQDFPKKAEKLETETGVVFLMKTDILKRLMWYTYAGDPTFYPLTVEQVADIIELNENGKKGQPLGQIVIVEEVEEEEVEQDYADTVGQITLSTLEKTGKKRKKKKKAAAVANLVREDHNKALHVKVVHSHKVEEHSSATEAKDNRITETNNAIGLGQLVSRNPTQKVAKHQSHKALLIARLAMVSLEKAVQTATEVGATVTGATATVVVAKVVTTKEEETQHEILSVFDDSGC